MAHGPWLMAYGLLPTSYGRMAVWLYGPWPTADGHMAYGLLPTAYGLLPTAYGLLPTAYGPNDHMAV